MVAGACQLNPFPPSLPTHAGARANLDPKRSTSTHLVHLRPPWPVPQSPLEFIVWRTLFGWHLLWSVVPSDVIPSFLCSPVYFALFLVVIMWRKMQSFQGRPASMFLLMVQPTHLFEAVAFNYGGLIQINYFIVDPEAIAKTKNAIGRIDIKSHSKRFPTITSRIQQNTIKTKSINIPLCC